MDTGTVSVLLWIVCVLALLLVKANAQNGVLQLRFVWAPIFCNAGSSNGVPQEFCGVDPQTARPRFMRHRQSIMRPLEGWRGCSPDVPYSDTFITGQLRDNLHCTSNSYTEGNDDGWFERLWEEGAGCGAKQIGMNQTEYFQLMTDLFEKYNPDKALKKNKVQLKNKGAIRTSTYLKILKKRLGKEGFVTCDGGTGQRLSTFSICISPKAPYKITNCPKSVLQNYKNRCPKKITIERGFDSLKNPTKECKKYYPV